MSDSEIEVFAELNGATHRVGTLRAKVRGGRNGASFAYHEDWSKVPGHFSLEPAMAVGLGTFSPDKGREIFASIGDSAPDTWGRRLMQRMERRTAKRSRPANGTPLTRKARVPATWMVMAGIELEEVARFLGATKAMIERVYGKHSPDYLQRAATALRL